MILCRILLQRNHGCRTDKTDAGSHLATCPNLRYGVVILNWITVCILRLNLYVHDFCDIFSLFFFDVGGCKAAAEDIQALLNYCCSIDCQSTADICASWFEAISTKGYC